MTFTFQPLISLTRDKCHNGVFTQAFQKVNAFRVLIILNSPPKDLICIGTALNWKLRTTTPNGKPKTRAECRFARPYSKRPKIMPKWFFPFDFM